VGVLEGSHEEPDELVDCARLAQWGVVCCAEGQVADETNDGLHQRPPGGWMQQLDNHLQTVVEAHGVLGHLGLNMAGGKMTKGAHLRKIK